MVGDSGTNNNTTSTSSVTFSTFYEMTSIPQNDVIDCTTALPMEGKKEKARVRSGRCKRCGEWMSDLDFHDKKGCRGVFKRR
jgi:hypothetical protein